MGTRREAVWSDRELDADNANEIRTVLRRSPAPLHRLAVADSGMSYRRRWGCFGAADNLI